MRLRQVKPPREQARAFGQLVVASEQLAGAYQQTLADGSKVPAAMVTGLERSVTRYAKRARLPFCAIGD